MGVLVLDAGDADKVLPFCLAECDEGFSKDCASRDANDEIVVESTVDIEEIGKGLLETIAKFCGGLIFNPTLKQFIDILDNIFGVSEFELFLSIFVGNCLAFLLQNIFARMGVTNKFFFFGNDLWNDFLFFFEGKGYLVDYLDDFISDDDFSDLDDLSPFYRGKMVPDQKGF
jgi:hypothetical protein